MEKMKIYKQVDSAYLEDLRERVIQGVSSQYENFCEQIEQARNEDPYNGRFTDIITSVNDITPYVVKPGSWLGRREIKVEQYLRNVFNLYSWTNLKEVVHINDFWQFAIENNKACKEIDLAIQSIRSTNRPFETFSIPYDLEEKAVQGNYTFHTRFLFNKLPCYVSNILPLCRFLARNSEVWPVEFEREKFNGELGTYDEFHHYSTAVYWYYVRIKLRRHEDPNAVFFTTSYTHALLDRYSKKRFIHNLSF